MRGLSEAQQDITYVDPDLDRGISVMPSEHAEVSRDTEEALSDTQDSFELTANPDEGQLEQAFRLRARVYANEKGFISPDSIDPVKGIETDEYDAGAKHIIIMHKGKIVGNMRVIHLESNGHLPVEKFFDIQAPEGSMEASRFIVRTENCSHKDQRLVSLVLLRETTLHAIDEGAPYVYMTIENDLYGYLTNIGIPLEQVSEPKDINEYNSTNTAYRVPPTEVVKGIIDADTKLVPTHRGTLRTRLTKMSPVFFETRGGSSSFSSSDLETNMKPFERNLGFLTKEEQEKIMRSSVAIAGTGGDGGMLALQLARLGVGKFKLADPENFEIENLNRQAASSHHVLNKNKAEVVARAILDINPAANVEVYLKGVTADNVRDFISGSDLVIDETEFTVPEVGTLIARESRVQGRRVLMALNVGFGCYVTSFNPEGYTFEDMIGVSKDASIEDVKGVNIPIERWIGHIPSYTDLDMLDRVSRGEIPAPSVAPGVAIAAGIAASEAVWHLLDSSKRPQPTFAPECLSFDAVDGAKKVHDTPEEFRRSLGKLMARGTLT